MTVSYLDHPSLPHRLAYRHTAGKKDLPSVVYLTGFRSDMLGTKVINLEVYCEQKGLSFTCFDYSGHGRSDGRFEDGTITQWLNDTLAIIDNLTSGPLILIGSSMGGWLMTLAALKRPERIHGLIGIATACDFTEKLMWDALTPSRKELMRQQGYLIRSTPYNPEGWPITLTLIEDGRHHLLLDRPIAINRPVRLLHGLDDTDVPWSFSQKLQQQLISEDVTLTLIKAGDHRLSRESDIRFITQALENIL